MKDFFGKCGCNCGHCPAYKENAKTDEDRRRCSDGWAKYLGAKLKTDRCYCLGCQHPDPWGTGNLIPDRGCYIRPCTIYNEVKNCAYCSEFPCEELVTRLPGEDFRQRIEAHLEEKIPEEDYLRFVEPYEAVKHLKEIRKSLQLKDIKKPKEVKPIRARIVDFPENLALSKKETKALEKIHGVLRQIMSAKANTYARQLLVKRRRHHILGFLWELGFHGEFMNKGAQLVLDGRNYEDKWMVRKYDTTLHTYITQSFRILKELGVHGEFEKLEKKGWLLRLFLDERAGGKPALKIFKEYVTALADKYGEPVYAGNTRYKGEAMTRFSRADMRVLCKSKR